MRGMSCAPAAWPATVESAPDIAHNGMRATCSSREYSVNEVSMTGATSVIIRL